MKGAMAAHSKHCMPQAQSVLPPCSGELLQSQQVVHDPGFFTQKAVGEEGAHARARMLTPGCLTPPGHRESRRTRCGGHGM